jgi:hypothetical protein
MMTKSLKLKITCLNLFGDTKEQQNAHICYFIHYDIEYVEKNVRVISNIHSS